MTVYFLVAGMGDIPNGGTRIIYEHANRLAERGHAVQLIHIGTFPSERLRGVPRRLVRYLKRKSRRGASPHWFQFDTRVERRYHFWPRVPDIAPEEKIIATYFRTHEILPESVIASGQCYYLVQGVESEYVDVAILEDQWRSRSRNLVVSRWLQRRLSEVTETPPLIPNAIDREFFSPSAEKAARDVPTVLFFSMKDANKGSAETIAALNSLQASEVGFRVVSFGNLDPTTAGLKVPCEHHQMPPQTVLRDLYRDADIYVSSSKQEGWGLTLAEAASCGAALAVSDATGHFEFARPDKSALFHERGNPEQLAANLKRLINEPDLRAALVKQAQEDLEPFNWANAVDQMELALFGKISSTAERVTA
ncbi:glycosyltransferase family 4 protein [Erythrobacter sp. HA6-11]